MLGDGHSSHSLINKRDPKNASVSLKSSVIEYFICCFLENSFPSLQITYAEAGSKEFFQSIGRHKVSLEELDENFIFIENWRYIISSESGVE